MCCVWVHEHMPLLQRSMWLTGPTRTLSGTGGTLGHSMAWTPTVTMEQPGTHLAVSLELWKTGGAFKRNGSGGRSCSKMNAFLLVFPLHAQDSPRLWNSPSKDGMQAERSQARQDRKGSWKRHYGESISERDGRREVFVLLCCFWLFYSSTAWFYWWVV